jgi:hypothetical protein
MLADFHSSGTLPWLIEAENILNNQFTSVFTSEDPLQPLPDLGPSPHPTVSDIIITQEGVKKLLCHLNPHKATGPDQVSPRLLKETAKQISPALTLLFQASFNQGKVPEEWKSANINGATRLFLIKLHSRFGL